MSNRLTNIIISQSEKYGNRPAMSFINAKGEFMPEIAWSDFATAVMDVACGLETMGLQPADSVALFSANRPEILVTDFAAYYDRAVTVPIYSTSSQEQVEYILKDCSAKFLCVGDQKQYAIARKVAASCHDLECIILLDENIVTDAEDKTTISMSALMGLGRSASDMCRREVEGRRRASVPEDVATIIYTSGTTGEPKGAVLPHRCFNSIIEIHEMRLTMLSDEDTSLSFLPMSHIFEKAWSYYCLSQGMHIAINENPKEIAKVIRKVHPTCMCSVPRFWEKVYAEVNERISTMPRMRRSLVRMALKTGYDYNLHYLRQGKKAPWVITRLYRFFDKKIFAPLRKAIGVDRGNIFPTAGAPISANIVEFFHSIGVNVMVGYGLSETCATVTCYPTHDYVIGSVGTVMPELAVKISDDGEILVKGPTVMSGYHNKKKETAEAFTADGWFRTGDAGYFDDQGALVLTERIKDLFKTSNGKYIAPQAIESRLGEDKYIEQVAVIGDRQKYVTAIIIPAFEALKEYAEKKKIQFKTIDDLVRNSEIVRMIGERIERLQQGLAAFEQIKKFVLLPKEFTIESGELTNTLKIRRPVINHNYAKEIAEMYS